MSSQTNPVDFAHKKAIPQHQKPVSSGLRTMFAMKSIVLLTVVSLLALTHAQLDKNSLTCKPVNADSVQIFLYTRTNPGRTRVNVELEDFPLDFDPNKPTFFFIHGWLGSIGFTDAVKGGKCFCSSFNH